LAVVRMPSQAAVRPCIFFGRIARKNVDSGVGYTNAEEQLENMMTVGSLRWVERDAFESLEASVHQPLLCFLAFLPSCLLAFLPLAFGPFSSAFGFRLSAFGFRFPVFGLRLSAFGFYLLPFAFHLSLFAFRLSPFTFRLLPLTFAFRHSHFAFLLSPIADLLSPCVFCRSHQPCLYSCSHVSMCPWSIHAWMHTYIHAAMLPHVHASTLLRIHVSMRPCMYRHVHADVYFCHCWVHHCVC
jgi:hypothetical protein